MYSSTSVWSLVHRLEEGLGAGVDGLEGVLVHGGESPVLRVGVARLFGPEREGLGEAGDGVVLAGEGRALLGHAHLPAGAVTAEAAAVAASPAVQAGRRVEAAVGAEAGGRLARLEGHLVLGLGAAQCGRRGLLVAGGAGPGLVLAGVSGAVLARTARLTRSPVVLRQVGHALVQVAQGVPVLAQLGQVVVEVARVVARGAVPAALHAREAAVTFAEVAQLARATPPGAPPGAARHTLLVVLPLHGRALPLLGVESLVKRVVGRPCVRVSLTLRQRAN